MGGPKIYRRRPQSVYAAPTEQQQYRNLEKSITERTKRQRAAKDHIEYIGRRAINLTPGQIAEGHSQRVFTVFHVRIIGFIQKFFRENNRSPTLDELAKGFGVQNASSLFKPLKNLYSRV